MRLIALLFSTVVLLAGCVDYDAVAGLNRRNLEHLQKLEARLILDSKDYKRWEATSGKEREKANADLIGRGTAWSVTLAASLADPAASLAEANMRAAAAKAKFDVEVARAIYQSGSESVTASAYADVGSEDGLSAKKPTQPRVLDATSAAVNWRLNEVARHQLCRRLELARIQADYYAAIDTDARRATDIAALYLKVLEALRALRANGADIQKYLELSRMKRAFSDVAGMDREKLKKIGDDLKVIGDRLRPVIEDRILGKDAE